MGAPVLSLLAGNDRMLYPGSWCIPPTDVTGGPQCVVAPGSCTVLPQKTSLLTPLLSTPDGNTSHSISLSSASSIIAFWPIFEQCGDPFNDAGRNILKDIAYDAVLALEHKGLNFDTQAHCRCSPEYWSYYGAPGAAGRVKVLAWLYN